VLGSRSCHLVFEILCRQFMWKLPVSSFFMWRRYGVHVSLPYSRDERIAVWYTWIFVSSRIPRSFHNRLDSWPKVVCSLLPEPFHLTVTLLHGGLHCSEAGSARLVFVGHCGISDKTDVSKVVGWLSTELKCSIQRFMISD